MIDDTKLPRLAVEHFSVPSQLLRSSHGLRLDASHFDPRVAHALEVLRRSGMRLVSLGEVTKRVFIPGRFKRSYVAESYGLPFLQGSHITHLQPSDVKYVSSSVHKKIADWIINEGWILVTRSGTVGRVAMTPKAWNGWAASEHILRIVPDNDLCPAGYLYAFLASPLGSIQLTHQIYGAVVDELTEDQTKSVQVPLAVSDEQKNAVDAINEAVAKAMEARSVAVSGLTNAVLSVENLMSHESNDGPTGDGDPFTRDDFMAALGKVATRSYGADASEENAARRNRTKSARKRA